MDNVGKIDLKEQLKSLFDTGINLSIGQIGAIQWAITQVAISKTETTSWTMIDSDINLWKCSKCNEEWTFEYGGPEENNMHYCPHCGRKVGEPTCR